MNYKILLLSLWRKWSVNMIVIVMWYMVLNVALALSYRQQSGIVLRQVTW